MSKTIYFTKEPQVKIIVRTVRSSRRLSLRVSSISESVTLTAPTNTQHDVLLNFLKSKESWVREKIQGVSSKKIEVGSGTFIPIKGNEVEIKLCSSASSVKSIGNILLVPSKAANRGLAVENYLKKLAREELTEVATYYCSKLGVSYCSLKLRDPRSRWGSCSSTSNLMFSWRLIMAPKNVIKYLVAHEVSHLKHFNHSKDFWSEVYYLFGPYQNERKWLRNEGTNLHFYNFKVDQ
jgi:predicted metal-dependent hydrolase